MLGLKGPGGQQEHRLPPASDKTVLQVHFHVICLDITTYFQIETMGNFPGQSREAFLIYNFTCNFTDYS